MKNITSFCIKTKNDLFINYFLNNANIISNTSSNCVDRINNKSCENTNSDNVNSNSQNSKNFKNAEIIEKNIKELKKSKKSKSNKNTKNKKNIEHNKQSKINTIYISDNIFIRKIDSKIYKNIFIHYTGKNPITFYENLAQYITKCIIETYENDIILKLILSNYFYFLDNEQLEIKNIAKELIASDEHNRRKELVYISVIDYLLSDNKFMILDGFITFRLRDYLEILDYIIELSVNNYLVKKEYLQFIELLKKYISSATSNCKLVHLVYLNNESIILDSSYTIINHSIDSVYFEQFSDIEFSSNDYSLNTLLNLLPEKIYIHLLDSIDKNDEFITTLKLIFENRIVFCTNNKICSICSFYKTSNLKNLD